MAKEWYEDAPDSGPLSEVLGKYQNCFASREAGFLRSPARLAWEHQLKRAIGLAAEKAWSSEILDLHLEAAYDFLDGLSNALTANGVDKEQRGRGVIALEPPLLDLPMRSPARSISGSSLDECLEHYLKHPSIACGPFDWMLTNAYLHHNLVETWESVCTGAAFGRINWSYLLLGRRPWVLMMTRVAFGLARDLLSWIIFPGLALYLWAIGSDRWVAGAAVAGLAVCWRLISLRTSRLQKLKAATLIEALEALQTLHALAYCPLWSPTDFLRRVRWFERKYPRIFLTPIPSLLARAVRRDPDVLALSGDVV